MTTTPTDRLRAMLDEMNRRGWYSPEDLREFNRNQKRAQASSITALRWLLSPEGEEALGDAIYRAIEGNRTVWGAAEVKEIEAWAAGTARAIIDRIAQAGLDHG